MFLSRMLPRYCAVACCCAVAALLHTHVLAYLPLARERQVLKLSTWMRKHQDESLPDGGKGQLMECIQIYHKTALAEPQLKVGVMVRP